MKRLVRMGLLMAVLILHKIHLFFSGRVVEMVVKSSVNMFLSKGSSCNCRFPEDPPH